jgi:hypothetical protein
MGIIPPPKSCGLYLPGHEIHWIQAIHSNDQGEVPPVPCTVDEVLDDGTTVVEISGERLELWTHDPERLRAILAERGLDASYQKRWRLLRIPDETATTGLRGDYCIDVTPASDPDRRPCPTEPRHFSTLAERLLETGGFTIAASELDRWLAQLKAVWGGKRSGS